MLRLSFVFIIIPSLCFSQMYFSVNLLERTDTKKQIDNSFELCIGQYLNKDIIVGLTNERSVADYIEYGYSPVQDSFIVSKNQIFIKYNFENNLAFTLTSPIKSLVQSLSPSKRIRVGIEYYFYSDNINNLDFYVNYNTLLRKNKNGFRKGEFNLGLSSTIPSKQTSTLKSNFFDAFYSSSFYVSIYNWINKPLKHGYRQLVVGN